MNTDKLGLNRRVSDQRKQSSIEQEILTQIRGRLILAVEMDENDKRQLQQSIKALNLDLKLFIVNNGQELLDYLYHQGPYENVQQFPRPDLILSELNMPMMNGYEVLQSIRDSDDESLREIPFIVNTRITTHDELNRLYLLGAKCCIDKVSSVRERQKIMELMIETHLTQKREKDLLRIALQSSMENRQKVNLMEDAYDKFMQTQSKFIQSSKMAALGELGANIAHELNQPLTGILSITDYMRQVLGQQHMLDKELLIIHDQAIRMSLIIENLLQFAQPQDNIISEVSIPEVIDATLALFKATLRNKNITHALHIEDNLPHAHGNFNKLQQVILNLLVNAKNALIIVSQEHKKLSISVHLKVMIKKPSANSIIEIVVSDNGIDINPEIEQKMFGPFFTTYNNPKSSGLGLYISYSIMKDMGGDLYFRRGPKQEKQFVVEIPIYPILESSSS